MAKSKKGKGGGLDSFKENTKKESNLFYEQKSLSDPSKSPSVDLSEYESAKPSNPKGPSLSENLKSLGDLAKLPAFMGRKKPEALNGDVRGTIINGAGLPVKPDTTAQKSYALSMRYRMPKKFIEIANNEPGKLKRLAQYILLQLRLEEHERAEYINRLVKYRQSFTDFVSAGLDPAFEGAHDVHVPHAFAAIKAMHARIFQAMMGVDPHFALKPRNPVPEIQKEDKENLMSWVIDNYSNQGEGWEGTIDRDIWNYVGDGTALTKQWWKRDVRKFVDVEETLRRPIQLDEEGYPIVDEKEVEKEEVVWDCPMIETVKLEDFYIIGHKADDIDSADIIIHSQQYTKSELIKMARLGFFFEDATESTIKYEPPLNTAIATNIQNIALKQLDDFTTGLNKVASQAGIRSYMVHECYLRYDIDEDGIDEELVVWIEDRSRNVLRITYLERVAPGGKRPFTIKKFSLNSNGPYGKGLGELLYGLGNEIDYIHNQRLDYGTLQNLPFFFYRAASGLNPIEFKIGPGMGIPVDDPAGDVMFPRLNGGTAYGFQEEEQVTKYSEQTSGITAFSLGSLANQGATRTATGTAALVNELNANIDIHIKRYQRGYKRNLYLLDLQLQDLLPLGTIIRVAGVDGKDIYKRFDNRDAIKFATDYDLTANSINSNKAIERETAQMMLQQLANPIALQTGIVNQDNLYSAFKNLLQKFEINDIDAYITKPADMGDSNYSAKDEINMIIAGVKPPLSVKDKHQEKLAYFQEFEQSDDFGWLTEHHLPLYMEVKQYHENMANAIASQAQNPVLQQGQMNLGLSGQLAAGAGAPAGVAQQQSDLGQAGGMLRPLTGAPNQPQGPQ